MGSNNVNESSATDLGTQQGLQGALHVCIFHTKTNFQK